MSATKHARLAECRTCRKLAPIGARRVDCAPCRANYDRQHRHGVSPSQWRSMMRKGYLCANPYCDRAAEVVDHDHRTGRIRGALCRYCNVVLGMVEDNPERPRGLIDYL